MKILDPNGLVDNLYKYVQTNIEITKVEIQEKIEDTIKKLGLIAILTIISILFLIFLLITLSSFLNEILESQYLGYLIVTGILGIFCGLVYMKINPLLKQPNVVEKLKDL